jgi:hypothetical protein
VRCRLPKSSKKYNVLKTDQWSFAERNRGSDKVEIVITPEKGHQEQKMAAAIHPTRFGEMTALWQNLFGAELRTLGMVAVFPLSALSEENEVHVVYDRPVTQGSNALGGTHCDDCSASFKLKKVR